MLIEQLTMNILWTDITSSMRGWDKTDSLLMESLVHAKAVMLIALSRRGAVCGS